MYISTLVAASLAALPALVSGHAHPVEGAPQLFGRRAIRELKERNPVAPLQNKVRGVSKEKRQIGGTDGQCGAGKGSCSAGYCCSGAGWCGKGTDYCSAPDAQYLYGSGADTLVVPSGSSTESIARTKVGSVLYGGEGIYDCTVTGTVALTYDDGPYDYTAHVLDLLDQYGAKATFFITGNNIGKGRIDDASKPWPALIKRMYDSGHQIASHTWGHQDLSVVDDTVRKNQMVYNEMAFRNILGVIPTYMRPPYSSCTSKCQTLMSTLGYHIVYFDLDTEDYLNTQASQAQVPKNNFYGNITTGTYQNSAWLDIQHDIHYQTAYNLTEFMLKTITDLKYKAVTLGDCLADPKANWYRTAGGAASSSSVRSSSSTKVSSSSTKTSSVSLTSTKSSSVSSVKASSTSSILAASSASSTKSSAAPSSSASVISTDGSCGGASAFTCVGSVYGDCCSQYGWCGSGADYCTNCQSAFGCGSASSNTVSAPTATPSAGTKISTDGSCGGVNGYTCVGSVFGNCCSQYGWCGSTVDHCTACQSAFGCGGSSSVQVSSSTRMSTTTRPTSSTRTSSSARATSTTSTKRVCFPFIGCL